MSNRVPYTVPTAVDSSGDTLPGAQLFFYENGTTTFQNTYSDPALTQLNANPVVADAAGRFGDIFLQALSYTEVLKDADDNQIYSRDDVFPPISNNITYDVPFTGGVDRTVGSRLDDSVFAADFGVTGDGTTDDTVAFDLANDYAELNEVTLIITGTPLISSTISITSRVHWRFTGAFGVNGSGVTGPWSFLKKAASLNGACVQIENAAKGVTIEGGGIEGVNGNGGDGLVILGNSAIIRDFCVLNMGNDGIRIGQDASGTNSNNFYLDNVYSASNGNHGFHIRDEGLGLSSNSNAGQANRCHATLNTSAGLYIQNIAANTFINFHSESNTGWGVHLDGYSEQITFVGGDIENNTAGAVNILSTRREVSNAVDNGSGLVRLTLDDTTGMTTGDTVKVADIVGTTEANGTFVLTLISGTQIDLQSSSFSNAYVSGGNTNNYAGSHSFLRSTVTGTFTDNGWLTTNLSSGGPGTDSRPVSAEGTFTPSLIGSSTAGTPTYGSRQGSWKLTGITCEVFFNISLSATTGMVGLLRMSDLPFFQLDSRSTGFLEIVDHITFPAGTSMASVVGLGAGLNTATFNFSGTGIVSTPVNVTAINAGGNTRVRGYMRYDIQST